MGAEILHIGWCERLVYTVDFTLYTGNSTTASENGLSYDMVVVLVKNDFLGSGYIAYWDNFCTRVEDCVDHVGGANFVTKPDLFKSV